MNELKSFTRSILSELSNRMKNTNKRVQIKKELITLEGLMKNDSSKKDIFHNNKQHQAAQSSPAFSDSKKVITQTDMESMGDIHELQINKGDIVTPLALDLLKRKKIKLVIK